MLSWKVIHTSVRVYTHTHTHTHYSVYAVVGALDFWVRPSRILVLSSINTDIVHIHVEVSGGTKYFSVSPISLLMRG